MVWRLQVCVVVQKPLSRQKRAPKLDRDPDSRKLIAFMRMAGIPRKDIAKMTGRNKATIDQEVRRSQHKKLLHRFLKAASRRVNLPEEDWAVIEQYLKTRA